MLKSKKKNVAVVQLICFVYLLSIKTKPLIKHKKYHKKLDLCHQVSKQYFQALWTG